MNKPLKFYTEYSKIKKEGKNSSEPRIKEINGHGSKHSLLTVLYINNKSRLHNEELSDLYSSPNIVRVIKSRRMRWAGHVARMGEERGGV